MSARAYPEKDHIGRDGIAGRFFFEKANSRFDIVFLRGKQIVRIVDEPVVKICYSVAGQTIFKFGYIVVKIRLIAGSPSPAMNNNDQARLLASASGQIYIHYLLVIGAVMNIGQRTVAQWRLGQWRRRRLKSPAFVTSADNQAGA